MHASWCGCTASDLYSADRTQALQQGAQAPVTRRAGALMHKAAAVDSSCREDCWPLAQVELLGQRGIEREHGDCGERGSMSHWMHWGFPIRKMAMRKRQWNMQTQPCSSTRESTFGSHSFHMPHMNTHVCTGAAGEGQGCCAGGGTGRRRGSCGGCCSRGRCCC